MSLKHWRTYTVGSSEAMKREPRLDEEHYLQAVGYRNEEGEIESPLEFTRKHLKSLEDMYLEDSIIELQEKDKC